MEKLELTIKIPFSDWDGLEMETGLNKAIDELSKVLERKGLREMELDGIDEDFQPLYKITIKPVING